MEYATRGAVARVERGWKCACSAPRAWATRCRPGLDDQELPLVPQAGNPAGRAACAPVARRRAAVALPCACRRRREARLRRGYGGIERNAAARRVVCGGRRRPCAPPYAVPPAECAAADVRRVHLGHAAPGAVRAAGAGAHCVEHRGGRCDDRLPCGALSRRGACLAHCIRRAGQPCQVGARARRGASRGARCDPGSACRLGLDHHRPAPPRRRRVGAGRRPRHACVLDVRRTPAGDHARDQGAGRARPRRERRRRRDLVAPAVAADLLRAVGRLSRAARHAPWPGAGRAAGPARPHACKGCDVVCRDQPAGGLDDVDARGALPAACRAVRRRADARARAACRAWQHDCDGRAERHVAGPPNAARQSRDDLPSPHGPRRDPRPDRPRRVRRGAAHCACAPCRSKYPARPQSHGVPREYSPGPGAGRQCRPY